MKNNFIAQHRRGAIIYFPLFPLMGALFMVIVMFTDYDSSQLIAYVIIIAVFMALSIGIFLFALFNFYHKVNITKDEIILTGIRGVINRYKLTDIKKIVYHAGYGRSNVPYLIIEDGISENKHPNSIMNKKGEFIKLDCNKERATIIAHFWGGEIEGLPEKYKIN